MRRLASMPVLLIAALAATLLFAAAAAAEVRVGEAASPTKAGIPAETDILGAAVNFDTTTGTATFTVTTAAEQHVEPEEAGAELGIVAFLTIPKSGSCTFNPSSIEPLVMEIYSPYAESKVGVVAGASEGEPTFSSGTESVVGTKTILIGASKVAVNEAYTCATVLTVNEADGSPTEGILDEVNFPVATYVAPTPAPAPQPTPAALSLGKTKSLKAKVGKWVKQKVTVTNTGGTAVASVAVKATAPKGVTVRPGTTKLPALLPGQSWTFTVDVKLSAKAAKKSKVSVVAGAGSLSATSSFDVALAGS